MSCRERNVTVNQNGHPTGQLCEHSFAIASRVAGGPKEKLPKRRSAAAVVLADDAGGVNQLHGTKTHHFSGIQLAGYLAAVRRHMTSVGADPGAGAFRRSLIEFGDEKRHQLISGNHDMLYV